MVWDFQTILFFYDFFSAASKSHNQRLTGQDGDWKFGMNLENKTLNSGRSCLVNHRVRSLSVISWSATGTMV